MSTGFRELSHDCKPRPPLIGPWPGHGVLPATPSLHLPGLRGTVVKGAEQYGFAECFPQAQTPPSMLLKWAGMYQGAWWAPFTGLGPGPNGGLW